jgi:16S rRNA (adenine1518-N6/adenine1519-N6)-dimethyltransferase
MAVKKATNSPMTLSEIQRTLADLQTSPTRSLGQNFLHDQNLAKSIVSLLDIQPGDHIVEIGPGLGSLTEFLEVPGTRLTLLEKDDRLIPHLRRKFEHGTTRVFHGDALTFDLRELWGSGPVKVVGNLPYYISTPLIAKFTSALSPASVLILTLQLALDGLRRGGFRRRRKGRLDPGDLRPGKLGFRLEFAHLGLQQRPQLIRTLPLCAHLDQRAVALCDHLLQLARP